MLKRIISARMMAVSTVGRLELATSLQSVLKTTLESGSGVSVKGRFLKKEQAKKELSVSALVVESETDSECSRPKSVSTITIATEVEGASLS
jgi:hypothetical protein